MAPSTPPASSSGPDHDPELAELLVKDDVLDVVANYVDLVEEFVERDAALAGFVKSTTSKITITRIVRKEQGNAWANDAAFFRQILERHDDEGERITDALTFTSGSARASGRTWCSRPAATRWASSRNSTTRPTRSLSSSSTTRARTCCTGWNHPTASPATRETRDAITRQVLADVAAERGPPLAVRKADELARIGGDEKERSARRSNGSSTASNSASTTTSGGVCPSKSRLGRDRGSGPAISRTGSEATDGEQVEARRPDQASAPATSTRSTATSTSAASTPTLANCVRTCSFAAATYLLALFEPRGIGDSKATRTSSSPNRWTVPGGDRVELVADPDERGALLGAPWNEGARSPSSYSVPVSVVPPALPPDL